MSVPLSGEERADGEDVADGARLALADAGGEAGGIAVEAEYLDAGSQSDPVRIAENARTATEDASTIAYVGELTSRGTRTSLPITNSAGILHVSPGAGAQDLVSEEPFNDQLPELYQGAGGRTFARLVPSDAEGSLSGPIRTRDLPAEGQLFLDRFGEEYGRSPGDWAAYGYEAMASILAAIDRSDDPTSRSAVVDAYFDQTERKNSVLGTYVITPTGETSLDDKGRALRQG